MSEEKNEKNENLPTLEEAADEIVIPVFEEEPCEIDEKDVIRAAGGVDEEDELPSDGKDKKEKKKFSLSVFEFIEMFAIVTVVIMLCFSFFFRINIVEGPSMENTLHTGEFLIVSDLFYDPKPGDIVVLHDVTASSEKKGIVGRGEDYTEPIVKRVIAVGGQTVDIDFENWVLTVDGEPVDESAYRRVDDMSVRLTSDYEFPITVEEGKVFVMGDNRNHSADSRRSVIGQVDEKCIVGKALVRFLPADKFTVFKNPHEN